MTTADPPYDRALLLAGARRNMVLELWEVERYGADSYRDPDYVSIYGLRPAEWHARGIRLLGRTAVECTRDGLGDAIGRDVAAVTRAAPPTGGTLVVDLFAGSGNTLHWLLRHQPRARGLGFELDAAVFDLTRRNLALLGLPIDVAQVDYRAGLAGAAVPGSTCGAPRRRSPRSSTSWPRASPGSASCARSRSTRRSSPRRWPTSLRASTGRRCTSTD
jgi:hypothetical protein